MPCATPHSHFETIVLKRLAKRILKAYFLKTSDSETREKYFSHTKHSSVVFFNKKSGSQFLLFLAYSITQGPYKEHLIVCYVVSFTALDSATECLGCITQNRSNRSSNKFYFCISSFKISGR